MKTYLFGIVAALLVTVFVWEMLRRGVLREKFAALWLVVCAGMCVFAVFPPLVISLSHFVGIALPSNFLFILVGLILLLISVQLSYEVSRVESRSRRLAEDFALLEEKVSRLENLVSAHPDRRGCGPQHPSRPRDALPCDTPAEVSESGATGPSGAGNSDRGNSTADSDTAVEEHDSGGGGTL